MNQGNGKHGRRIAISLPRQFINDLVYFGHQIPGIPVQRAMNVARTRDARSQLRWPPSWVVIFAKAYAQVCDEFPQLRRSYLKFPWASLFEHTSPVASIAMEKELDGEPAVSFLRLGNLLENTLTDLDASLRNARDLPIQQLRSYRTAKRLHWLPTVLRRSLWWIGLNVNGRLRAREFGTFGLSVYASLGAESLHPISPLTTTLNYGPIADDGSVNVRIVYDHRVMDGAVVARALARFESVLNTQLVEELLTLRDKAQGRERQAA
jgi:hypothetical protein